MFPTGNVCSSEDHADYLLNLRCLDVEILAGLASGMTDCAIARRVGCSERNIRRHVASMAVDLRVNSRFQIALLLSEFLLLKSEELKMLDIWRVFF